MGLGVNVLNECSAATLEGEAQGPEGHTELLCFLTMRLGM